MIFEETHTLSNGVKIPKLGLGTWSIPDDTAANMRLGNGKAFLIKIISQNIPFICYARSLNALRCVNEAATKK